MKRPLPPNLATVPGHPPHRRPHAFAALQTGPNNNKNRGACWAEDATMWNYYGSLSTDKGSDNVLKLTFEFVYANDDSPARKQANNSLAIPPSPSTLIMPQLLWAAYATYAALLAVPLYPLHLRRRLPPLRSTGPFWTSATKRGWLSMDRTSSTAPARTLTGRWGREK